MNGLGRSPLPANDAGYQWLDDVIAKNGIGAQLSDAVGGDTVTARLADAFQQTFATDLRQIVSRSPGVVGFEVRSGDFRQSPNASGCGGGHRPGSPTHRV